MLLTFLSADVRLDNIVALDEVVLLAYNLTTLLKSIMDHLPIPAEPNYPPLEVPFLGYGYYGGPFLTYAHREGITRADIYRRSPISKPRAQVSAFLQSWLFFGLVTEVLQREVCTDDFVCTNDKGNKLLTTARLPELTLEWIQYVRSLSDDKHEAFETTQSYLAEARSVLLHLSVLSPELLDREVSISLAAVGEYLTAATSAAYQTPNVNVAKWIPGLANDDILSLRMRAQGWCPSVIGILRSKTSVEVMYYASNLEKPGVQDHDRCNLDRCIAYQIDPGQYVTKHSEGHCLGPACQHIHADQKAMLKILEEGSIPLICEIGLEIGLVASAKVDQYVAISHVWSDGMGNNSTNSLPQCQLSYLSEVVGELYPYSKRFIPFWVDTICFPLQPPEAYNLAMQQMRATYEDADKVLVLDSYIRPQKRALLSDEECLIRIFCSGWMRRLWTLQEGVLAKALLFQFADSALDIDVAYDSLFEPYQESFNLESEWSRSGGIYAGIVNVFVEVRMLVTENMSWISSIARAMAFRSTSVSTDEALCLGALLDLDMKRIVAVSEDQRMEEVWTLLGEAERIPPNALFAGGPKLRTKGYGWAPSSLLTSSNVDLHSDRFKDGAVLRDQGLVVQCPGFFLSWIRPVTHSFYFCDQSNRHFKVTLPFSSTQWEDWPTDPNADDSCRCPSSIALMCRGPLEPISDSGLKVPNVAAILVSVERTEDNVAFVRFMTKVYVVEKSGVDAAALEIADRCILEGEEEVVAGIEPPPSESFKVQLEWDMDIWCGVSGISTPISQVWCVM